MAARVVFSALIIFLSPVLGFSQTLFYQGRTITIILGTSAGDPGDLRRRAISRFLKKHIPGSPTIVLKFMPGGGGRKAANNISRAARPDGLTIGAVL